MSMIEETIEPSVIGAACGLHPMPTQKRYAWHPATGLHEWDSDCADAPPGVPCCKAVYMDLEVFEALKRE